MDGAPFERQKRARTALIALRAPWLYGQQGRVPKPGDSAILDAGQLRAVRRAVRKARADGQLTVEEARSELDAVKLGLDTIDKGPLRDVGAYFPVDGCFPARHNTTADRRQKNKAARKSRKAQRPKKKRRR